MRRNSASGFNVGGFAAGPWRGDHHVATELLQDLRRRDDDLRLRSRQ